MRRWFGVVLTTLCLGLAGCSLFGKKSSAHARNDKPFVGTETAAPSGPAALPRASNGPLPGANGLLAGRIVAEKSGDPVQAVIQVVNLEEEKGKQQAKFDVFTDQNGYFTIPNLKVGGQYELIARSKDGSELMSKKVIATPPSAALYIGIDRKYTGSDTPPLPADGRALPDKKAAAGTESSSENTSSATMDPPKPLHGEAPPSPANIADGGYTRLHAPAPRVAIPNAPILQGNPQWENATDDRSSPPPAVPPPPPSSVELPNTPTKVPSCLLLGQQLHNFALYDIDGNVWEYQRQKHGRLMLLDFWHHQCGFCLRGMHHLAALQRYYGSYGLQVVGIACERGSLAQQQATLRPYVGRYNVNYPILLSGATPESSPVVAQFQADQFPLLVLIDERGRILWHRKGMEESDYEMLRRMIDNRLVRQHSPP